MLPIRIFYRRRDASLSLSELSSLDSPFIKKDLHLPSITHVGSIWALIGTVRSSSVSPLNLKNYPSPGKLAGVSRLPLQRSVRAVSHSSRALLVMSEKFPLKCCIKTVNKRILSLVSLQVTVEVNRWRCLNLIFLLISPGVSVNL